MKRFLVVVSTLIIAICCVVSFSGCLPWFFTDTDESEAKKMLEQFITCLDREDKAGIKALFAPNKIADIKDFDEDIDDLLEYYDGDYVSYRGGHGTHSIKDYNYSSKEFSMSYDVTTNTCVYRMSFEWCVENTSSGNVGIWSFNIIKYDDDVKQNYSYWGDGSNTKGINIGEVYPIRLLDVFAVNLQNEDTMAIKAAFAPNTIEVLDNFDESIENLIDYFEGYHNDFYSNKEMKKSGDKYSSVYELSYDIITTLEDDTSVEVARYRMCAKWCTKDLNNESNVGLWSFYITKNLEEENETSYWGDGLWTNGINIE